MNECREYALVNGRQHFCDNIKIKNKSKEIRQELEQSEQMEVDNEVPPKNGRELEEEKLEQELPKERELHGVGGRKGQGRGGSR